MQVGRRIGGLWGAWAVAAAVSAVSALTDRAWLAMVWLPAWAVFALLAPRRLDPGQWPAYRQARKRRTQGHPVRALVRQVAAPALVALGLALVMAGPGHQGLQALGMTVAMVGVIDLISAALQNHSWFHRQSHCPQQHIEAPPAINRYQPGTSADPGDLTRFDGW